VTARRWIAIGAAALLVALCVFIGWLLRSESGAQWAASRAVSFMDGKLAIGNVRGTLVTPLSVSDVRYRDAEKGVDLAVESASVNLVFRELLSWRVHVLDAKVAGVNLALREPTKPPKKNNEPFTLKPPIDIVVDRFTLEGAKVSKDAARLLEATRAC
jgi:translocation and assembly module TamB